MGGRRLPNFFYSQHVTYPEYSTQLKHSAQDTNHFWGISIVFVAWMTLMTIM